MRIKPSLALFSAACLFVTATQADDLFSAKLQLSCRSAGGNNGKLATQKLRETDVIGAAIGSSDRNTIKRFGLVYNATANALQVVDNTGALVTNVLFFNGGAFTSTAKQSSELTFVFLPDVADAVGTAVINEKAAKRNTGTKKDRANINATLQLYLVDDQNLGGSGPVGGGIGDTNTNTTVSASVVATNISNLKWFTVNPDGTITTNGVDESLATTNGNGGSTVTVVTNANGSITTVTNAAPPVVTTVTNANGSITTITNAASPGVTLVTNADGSITTITNAPSPTSGVFTNSDGSVVMSSTNSDGSIVTVTTSTNGTVTTTTNMTTSVGGPGTTDVSIDVPAIATASSAGIPSSSAASGSGTFFSLLSVTSSNSNVRVCTGRFTAGKRFIGGVSINTNTPPDTNAVSTPITTPSTDTNNISGTNGIGGTNSISGTNGTSITTNSPTTGTSTGTSGTTSGSTGTLTVP
jgi:hypothetical protein